MFVFKFLKPYRHIDIYFLFILQIPNLFDEDTVQRQLRYTGMLETVRIRQAGYNVRLSYEEFIHLYRILLPKGLLRYFMVYGQFYLNVSNI